MVSTEQKPGIRVDIGIADVEAVYHDGMWGPSPDSRRAAWRTDIGHSITIRTANRSYGIRGPRNLSIEDLTAVARSLPLGR